MTYGLGNIYLELLLLCWVVVFIVDLSGITDSVAGWLHRTRLRKPWSCSLCMTWWTGLAWSLATARLSIPVLAYIAALAWAAHYIREVAVCLDDALLRIIHKLLK